jgi:hypothetical protein
MRATHSMLARQLQFINHEAVLLKTVNAFTAIQLGVWQNFLLRFVRITARE